MSPKSTVPVLSLRRGIALWALYVGVWTLTGKILAYLMTFVIDPEVRFLTEPEGKYFPLLVFSTTALVCLLAMVTLWTKSVRIRVFCACFSFLVAYVSYWCVVTELLW